MNNIGKNLWNLPNELKQLFRKLKMHPKNLISKTWSYRFNEICLNKKR